MDHWPLVGLQMTAHRRRTVDDTAGGPPAASPGGPSNRSSAAIRDPWSLENLSRAAVAATQGIPERPRVTPAAQPSRHHHSLPLTVANTSNGVLPLHAKSRSEKSPLSYLTEIVRAAGPFVSLSYTPPYAGPKTKMKNVTTKIKVVTNAIVGGGAPAARGPFPKSGFKKEKIASAPRRRPSEHC